MIVLFVAVPRCWESMRGAPAAGCSEGHETPGASCVCVGVLGVLLSTVLIGVHELVMATARTAVGCTLETGYPFP